ncbi:transcriptional repressor LexA [Oceanotoga sp. DSM 15011]|jgi:repressor LexA|uniref:LexA repressor n=1 Tax=Oceanotoga teriensis TaxID=515440 RepID=A0AA45HJG2_9BACT|nr:MULTISPECIES: transcriptional repressor LexA [Oceanotoga]MDN5342413.1 repressor LexA [Oceanotoga sp.]MDO7975506.1 transcriptional repressor LexA [Oceanotoga teriensis]PWJ96206.1 SOS-response transcriptional repressor LexA [Oceanotoga teriensis]UYO99989.1 transcriptional repressor LexA [Oceanotoga sp. DSM 15011]
MKALTKRQSQILEYLKDYIDKNGYAPSVRDIMNSFGFKSPRAAHKHLITLEEKGFIERKGVSRGIRLTPKSGEVFTRETVVPIIGKIAAGAAIEAVENISDSIPLPVNFFSKNEEHFALVVEGESMIEEHIKSGDYVIIQKQNHASDGDIVVALIEDNYATLKKFKKVNQKLIHLIPANKNMDIIKVDPKNLKIQGKMVGLIRTL